MNIIYAIILCMVGAILYWIGGQGKETIKWANTKFRDWGSTLCAIGILLLTNGVNPWEFTLVLLWAGFSIGDFGKFQWSIHAAACWLAFLPYAYMTHHMTAWYIQATIIPAVYGWSVFEDQDFPEETGRGLIILASAFLYMIR